MSGPVRRSRRTPKTPSRYGFDSPPPKLTAPLSPQSEQTLPPVPIAVPISIVPRINYVLGHFKPAKTLRNAMRHNCSSFRIFFWDKVKLILDRLGYLAGDLPIVALMLRCALRAQLHYNKPLATSATSSNAKASLLVDDVYTEFAIARSKPHYDFTAVVLFEGTDKSTLEKYVRLHCSPHTKEAPFVCYTERSATTKRLILDALYRLLPDEELVSYAVGELEKKLTEVLLCAEELRKCVILRPGANERGIDLARAKKSFELKQNNNRTLDSSSSSSVSSSSAISVSDATHE